MLLAALTAFFIIMGLFLDGISVVVLTTSIIIPDGRGRRYRSALVRHFSGPGGGNGTDHSSPVGFNLFVLQSLTGRDIFYIARAAIPFFIVMVLALVILDRRSGTGDLAAWQDGILRQASERGEVIYETEL